MQLEQLGPYRIGRKLGKGGMGSVYEAVDQTTGQRVAVKALTPQLAAAEGFRERFEAEIESLKKLQHEGIVRLYGYGEDDGVLFYSMELVDGPSLEQEINDGRRFDWQETLSIAIQVCRALKHAHDHGVVHRDVKPANLLLASDGRVKIADFGIARLFGATQLTTAGGILGTADYMSPEQVDGRAVTEKCDQYSLGCVMFALLAGRPPFRARTMPEMLQMQRFAEPEPVRRYAPQVPLQLDALVRQLLSKDPAQRFPNVLVLARHMEAMQKGLSRPAKPQDAASMSPSEVEGPLDATAALGADATLAPVEPLGRLETTDSGVYDAPTLADAGDQAAPVAAEPSRSAAAVAAPAPKTVAPPARERRFTTVDEEAERARREHGERWALVLQLAALTATLAALGYLGWRLTRPASAESLYATIAETLHRDGPEDLGRLEDEIEEFIDRFPDHERASEVRALAEELELQRLQRQVRVGMGGSRGKAMHPAAALYAEAVAAEDSDPARAAELLGNLITLFNSPAANGESHDDAQVYVTLARRQLSVMRKASEQEALEQLPALHERLDAARRLEESNPEQAAAMYEAVVDLYGERVWYAPVVDKAKRRLEVLSGSK